MPGDLVLHLFGQAQHLEEADHHVGDVDFPPAVAVDGQALMRVVVVVPAFAVAEQGDPPQVAAAVGRFVVAVAPDSASPS